jgi:hypothetical protein
LGIEDGGLGDYSEIADCGSRVQIHKSTIPE